ncbi:MAG: DUF6785 family protein [Armatimonadota bacterium]|nr:DUF6785 family protein [Armatimonadota bacterium]
MSLRATTLGVALLVVGVAWIRYASLITFGANIDNSVPSGPALAALLALIALDRLLAWLRRRRVLAASEIAVAYIIVLVGIPLTSLGIVRPLLPSLTALPYFAEPPNNYAELAKLVPGWVAPSDDAAIQAYFEGAANERVPWDAWLQPLASWALLLGCFFALLLAVAVLLRRPWTEHDRLTYPVATFAVELVGREGAVSRLPMLRDPLMWIGFGLAALFDGTNIAQALNPALPALGLTYPVGSLFTERPWSAMGAVRFYHRPEFLGFGYLVPLEILGSTWAFFLLVQLLSVGGTAVGYEPPGFPFTMRQSVGAYVAMAVLLVWSARRSLGEALQGLMGRAEAGDARRGWAYVLGAAGLAGMLVWARAAGMHLGLAALFFGVMLAVAITFTRVRAETGVPTNWAFPFGEAKKLILEATGSAPWARGGFQSLTIMSIMNFLCRGYFPGLMAFQVESLELGDRMRARRREIVAALVIAFVVGLPLAYAMHLQAFYQYGANVLEGGTIAGGYRTTLARQEFDLLSGMYDSPAPPQRLATGFAAGGAAVVTALSALRHQFLRLPVHPLGYALATSYGYLLWGPFLAVWVVKSLVVKLGGAGTYRRLVPLFLGIAFGHLFVAGLLWGAFGALLPGELYRKLHIDIG